MFVSYQGEREEEGGVFGRGSGLFDSRGGGGGLFDEVAEEEGEGEREGKRRPSESREADMESSVKRKWFEERIRGMY